MARPSPTPGAEARLALTAGIACYLLWGLVPLVFQAMARLGISPWETLAGRTIWAAPTALLFVLLAGQWGQVVAVFRKPRVLGWLTLSALTIGGNWAVYIWAVNSGRVLESSLGYYINPLLAMAAGAVIFRERIDRIGALAMVMAFVGVAIQALALGRLPLVSLTLAASFALYGVIRKRVDAAAQTGLLIECLVLAIPGLAYTLWLQKAGLGHLGAGVAPTLWLMACGPVTAVPLVLFAWAARRLPFSTMGFLQFSGPTITFAIGVLEGEAFTPLRALSFLFIWSGAAVFVYGAWRQSRRLREALAEPMGV